ncbi:hypothetical protein LCB40_13080 [Lactobacillus corticis]|uniref:Uncharacterized protein n=1 Tax=Lactobacillus corticis TaxID=2201249 RepID=A0A916QJ40_9LACO|nr:hypothetical protein LCB40_13080 [Lactobacillus corticis]
MTLAYLELDQESREHMLDKVDFGDLNNRYQCLLFNVKEIGGIRSEKCRSRFQDIDWLAKVS